MTILTDSLGFKYYKDKPKEFHLVTSPTEFLCLKDGKRKFCKDNVEVVCGEYLVFSPHSGNYYVRTIHPDSSPLTQSVLMQMIADRRISIQYSPETRTKISTHFNASGLTYTAFVRVNELLLELDELEATIKYDEGYKSHVQRVKKEIEYLTKNNQKHGKETEAIRRKDESPGV